MTGRRVIAVMCRMSSTVWVDVPADFDLDYLCDWVEDGGYGDTGDVTCTGRQVLDDDQTHQLLSRGYGVVVMDNDRRHVNIVSTWADLQAMRQQIDPPDPKAPGAGQRDIFGGEVAE